MNRQIDNEVLKCVEQLLRFVPLEGRTNDFWLAFYELVAVSYSRSPVNRLSVSSLAEELRRAGHPAPGNLATIYAHCLYSLAVRDGKRIYANGFNP